MADDIVNRLRDVTEMNWDGDEVTEPLCEEAADEIERLRAAGDALVSAHAEDLCDCSQPECIVIRDAHVAWQEARRG